MSSKGKVLAIDDDPDFLEFLRIVLEAKGYSVLWAHNAEQGLSLARTAHPDLILLDIMISYSMQGLDIKRKLQQDPVLCQIPLVVVSSILTSSDQLQNGNGDSTSVVAVLPKPIEVDALLSLLEQTISLPKEQRM